MAAILHCIATGIEDDRTRDLLRAWRGKSAACPLMCEIRRLRKQSTQRLLTISKMVSVGTALRNRAVATAGLVYEEHDDDFSDDEDEDMVALERATNSLMAGIEAWDTAAGEAARGCFSDVFENDSESVILSRCSSVDTVSSVSTDSSSSSTDSNDSYIE